MREITSKLHNSVMKDFEGVASEMARSGCNKDTIIKAFKSQLRIKTNIYYEKLRGLKPMKGVFENINLQQTADSKAEVIFYNLLKSHLINFRFQYKIGPYTADYLIAGYLVLELDGPHHIEARDNKRDAYMRSMGYKIIRVPMWVLVSCPEAIIDEIKEVIKIKRVK